MLAAVAMHPPSCTCQPQPPTSAHRKISHAHIATATPAEHIPSEAHREPPKWQRGPRANQKKPAHGKKSKNPSPGLSPRVLHEPTYSADERRARQFSEGSPRCAAEAIVAVVLGHLVRLPLCLPEVAVGWFTIQANTDTTCGIRARRARRSLGVRSCA